MTDRARDLDDDVLMSSNECARRLGVSTGWLSKARKRGDGPVYFRIGRLVRYRLSAVRIWIRKQEEETSKVAVCEKEAIELGQTTALGITTGPIPKSFSADSSSRGDDANSRQMQRIGKRLRRLADGKE